MTIARSSMPAVAAGNGKIYVIGGSPDYVDPITHLSITGLNEEYDPSLNTWSTKASMPSPRGGFGAAESYGRIYTAGGVSGSTVFNKLEVYNILTDTWSTKASLPTPIEGLALVAGINGKIYAIGGLYNNQVLNSVYEYDPNLDTWSEKASMPTARFHIGATVGDNGKIYAVGGVQNNYPYHLNVVEVYDPIINSWSTKANMPTPRYGFGLAYAGRNLYAVGGFIPDGLSSKSTSSVEEYDPSADLWTNKGSSFIDRAFFGFITATNGKMYSIGGYSEKPNPYGLGNLNVVQEATVIPSGNQVPTVDAGGPYSVNEGSTIQISATGNDPENSPLSFAWDLDNNGSYETSGQSVNFSASNLDGPDIKTIAVKVTDNGNLIATDTAIITIMNVSPVVGVISSQTEPILINTSINADVNFTDPGIHDTHTASWNWGDNTISSGTVNQQNKIISDNHTYTNPGIYEINVTIADDDGGSDQPDIPFQYVVVYDSSASGGFVTGAGTIESPSGAYIPDSTLSGTAKFGFVSKYQPGANTPTGDTHFKFQAAGFTFSSSSYQWLVVAGAQAKFKGEGTVNGSGNYGFQLSATDGLINGGGGIDKFRIKIWDKNNNDTVVYDNQLGAVDNADPTTSITGGNIILH